METRGEKMLKLRRARMAAAPPFLRGGFRPFFLGGALWAFIALVVWLSVFFHGGGLPSAFDALGWHRHEMLFGFVGAVIGGFLLTAIPNWTGRLPIAGTPLGLLFGLWMAARLANLFSAYVGEPVAALLDVGFYWVMAGLAAREVIAAGNRNVPIVGLVFLFGLADLCDHAALLGWAPDPMEGVRAGIALVVIMISLIGGRIIPSFTRNWLARQGRKESLPSQPGKFDLAVIAVTAIAMLAWAIFPALVPVGAALLLAGLLQAVRLARWSGLRTFSDPLVLILHVGYAWVPTGLLLLGATAFVPAIIPSAAIHALTAGAMATMILAVMSRATLGHTGRALAADRATILAYVLVTIGAVLRVLAALQLLSYSATLQLAGAAWAGAFLVFVLAYAPILFAPRLGEE